MNRIRLRNILILILLIFLSKENLAQTSVKGKVVDKITRLPLEGVTVSLMPMNVSGVTDHSGIFLFNKPKEKPVTFRFSAIGYKAKEISFEDLKNSGNQVELSTQEIELNLVTISGHAGDQYMPISKTDIAMRGVSNSQEVLRIIPGVVIGQHQGGGKAEQIFLRGFDADHGTDFRMDVDGLPINMVSHAHGQGFADSHFIIPETIENADFKKGPYTASKGDFATTGFVDFKTRNVLNNNLIKIEGGQFNTYRILGMFNLLHAAVKHKQQSWYVATEYRYSDAYFDNPQHFNRFNLFTKYNGKISPNSNLTVSATTFWSKWNASGQIPDRAVDEGTIGFFGALDPSEGGITYRTNLNAQVISSLNNGGLIKNQLYYSQSHFDLRSNFTFFLEDSVNGDEITQKETRSLLGYNGSYNTVSYIGATKLSSEAGVQLRADITRNSELSHTKNSDILLNHIKLGDITEVSLSPYVSETLKFNEHLSLNIGLRFDQFFNKYNNKFAGDSTLPAIGIYKAKDNIFSPKLNLYYHINDRMQFYLLSGKGFHSNDTRAVVIENGYQVLPTTYSADLGTVFKPAKNIIVNAALWYIYLQQEFVYSGDGGSVEFNGKTKRVGFDFSMRYEPVKSLYLDLDINYAHGRAIGTSKNQDYIPLAPVWTSSAGITYTNKNGLNGSLRYRFVGDRPANEDYSLTAKGYFISDAVLNYTKPKFEIGLVVNNIFNSKWKETQFATETRLKNEPMPVDEICFTPGTPFATKLSFTLKF